MELALTPTGRIASHEAAGSQPANAEAEFGRVAKAFASSLGEGLFVLATERFAGPLPPAASFWREFAARYLTAPEKPKHQP
jgi:hypothetical protein